MKYLHQLVAERLTGLSTEHYVTDDMQRGIDMEAEARSLYELRNDCLVDEVGFIMHPTIPYCGASPDGVIGSDGLIEIKCPRPERHVSTLLTNMAPADYLPQMYLQMACTGAKWCDFVSFCSAMPEHVRIAVVRVQRDEERIAQMEQEIEKFLAEAVS